MSFSVTFIGKPDAIKRKLDEESARLTDQSKAEFDAIKPALDTILDQQVGGHAVHLSANGHASFASEPGEPGKAYAGPVRMVKTYGAWQVEIKTLRMVAGTDPSYPRNTIGLESPDGTLSGAITNLEPPPLAPSERVALDAIIDDAARSIFSNLCEGDGEHSEALDRNLISAGLRAFHLAVSQAQDARIAELQDEVLAIRDDSRKLRIIAAQYGVAESMVSRIRSGLRWGHLP